MKLFLASLVFTGLMATVQAQETNENKNLFEDPGKKQVGVDFKPAPDKIETNFGTLN